MSLLLMIFYWVAIPVFALLAVQRLLRRARTPIYKRLVVVVGVAGFGGWFWLVAGEKLWLDHQVRELCAKDGGVRVYETVKLPAEKFNKYGQINFYRPIEGENALGPEYVFRLDAHYYRAGNPSLRRYLVQVFRRSDRRLLGESISYDRGGGDLPGPWQPSGFSCPEGPKAAGEVPLLENIFVKSTEE
ncbi:MAG: hypothetical protein ACYC2R_15895 [Burkholderiales bacterium]